MLFTTALSRVLRLMSLNEEPGGGPLPFFFICADVARSAVRRNAITLCSSAIALSMFMSIIGIGMPRPGPGEPSWPGAASLSFSFSFSFSFLLFFFPFFFVGASTTGGTGSALRRSVSASELTGEGVGMMDGHSLPTHSRRQVTVRPYHTSCLPSQSAKLLRPTGTKNRRTSNSSRRGPLVHERLAKLEQRLWIVESLPTTAMRTFVLPLFGCDWARCSERIWRMALADALRGNAMAALDCTSISGSQLSQSTYLMSNCSGGSVGLLAVRDGET
mmetsp:Transcript_22198/g.87434  ORF Transcript_22198/g.87434 Transcript_22198/m.87434 type:complete len:274 (-) Transcript_22198:332-1153(-)